MVLRLQAVLGTLNNFVIANGSEVGFANFGLIMQSLTDELIDELEDKDEATIKVFMERMGEIIAWIGHGDSSRLPDEIRAMAEELQPTPVESLVMCKCSGCDEMSCGLDDCDECEADKEEQKD